MVYLVLASGAGLQYFKRIAMPTICLQMKFLRKLGQVYFDCFQLKSLVIAKHQILNDFFGANIFAFSELSLNSLEPPTIRLNPLVIKIGQEIDYRLIFLFVFYFPFLEQRLYYLVDWHGCRLFSSYATNT